MLVAAIAEVSCGGATARPPKDAAWVPKDAPEPADASSDCTAGCDDRNSCTVDSCDSATNQCVHSPLPDDSACEGKPCTINSTCRAGVCLDGPFKKCTALDQCHVVGTCSPRTGECTNPAATNGTRCDDSFKCSYSDACTDGVCVGTPVPCASGVTCDPATGVCPGSFPTPLSAQMIESVIPPSAGNAFARGKSGEIYLAGSITDQVDLGAGMMTPTAKGVSNADVFMARIDPASLKATWSTSFAGPQAQLVSAFAVSSGASGPRLAAIGPLNGAIFVADQEIDALYKHDQYIMGVDATNGAGLWAWRLNLYNPATRASDDRSLGLSAIAGDAQNGAFAVCGMVACGAISTVDGGVPANPASVLGVASSCQGGVDAVVARLDGEKGTPQWGLGIGGTNNEDCRALAIDGESNTIVAGTYRFGSEVKIGSFGALPVIGAVKATWLYLTKVDRMGRVVWAHAFGTGTQSIVPSAIAALGADFVLAGTTDSASFGSETTGGEALGAKTFVARFDRDGTLVWIRGVGTGDCLEVSSIASVSDRILVSGTYTKGCTVGNVALPDPAALGGGVYVAQIESQKGSVVAAKGYGDYRFPNTPAGIVGRLDGTGREANSSLAYFAFHGSVDLGHPVGVISSESDKPPPTALVKLAP